MTALVGDGARPILPIRRVSARQQAAESIESWAPSRALMSEEVIGMIVVWIVVGSMIAVAIGVVLVGGALKRFFAKWFNR